jgi:serine protease Do
MSDEWNWEEEKSPANLEKIGKQEEPEAIEPAAENIDGTEAADVEQSITQGGRTRADISAEDVENAEDAVKSDDYDKDVSSAHENNMLESNTLESNMPGSNTPDSNTLESNMPNSNTSDNNLNGAVEQEPTAYQYRQPGTADTVDTTNAAGTVDTPNTADTMDTPNTAGTVDTAGTVGYRGGAYHSDWRNQQNQQNQQNQVGMNQSDSVKPGENPFGGGQPGTNQFSTEGQPGADSSYQNQQAGNFQTNTQTGQRRYNDYQFTPDTPVMEPVERKPMGTGKKFLVTAGMAIVFGLIAGGIMFGVNVVGNHLAGTDSIPQVQIPSTETPNMQNGGTAGDIINGKENIPDAAAGSDTGDASGNYTVAQVAKNCMPSVVSITNASVETVQDFFGGVQEYPSESTGSGIIVGQNDTELLIATNNHVVAEANSLTVAFSDDSVCEAQVKGQDSDNDLAVIAIKLEDLTEETKNAIRIVTLGDSDALEVGEQVVAIGNALGYGQSVTSGWVSAVNREVTDGEGNSTGKLIQTDAAINPGNSGGALINMKGELIGINSAKAAATEVEGMGYAIPVSVAEPILDELMNRETRYKTDQENAAYIGVTCRDVDATAAQMYGIPVGAFVDSVEEGGPSEAAGIQRGDVITKFDGQSITGSAELVSSIEYYKAGETVEVVISRAENGAYKEQTLTVTLGKRSEMTQSVDEQQK